MKNSQEISPGMKVRYLVPVSPKTKFAKVNTVLTALSTQDEQSVTFVTAPVAGANVEIFYGPEVVVPPAAYTVTGFGSALPPPALANGLTLFLNISVVTGTTPTLAVKLQCLDEVSGVWFDVPSAVFATATAASNQTLTLFPGAAAVANVSVNQTIRNIYRAAWTITGTTPSFTFSVGSQA